MNSIQISRSLVFFFIILFTSHQSIYSNEHLKIVIIGGGPTGLATAIEAFQNGDHVVIVEKRDHYTRTQTLFLIESTLTLLEKWGVSVPELSVLEINKDRKMGVVTIKDLENGLVKRVNELGIKIINGEFKNFVETEKKVIVTSQGEEVILPYDILVGADGSHSLVREQMGISMNHLGTAKGAIIYTPFNNPPNKMDISSTVKKNEVYLKKIDIPSSSIILVHASIDNNQDMNKIFEKERLVVAAWYAEWQAEARSIAEDRAKIVKNIDVILQQAETFSNEKQGIILVGDAVATAPFFHGTGLNSGFRTAVAAGNLFKNVNEHKDIVYSNYNKKVKEITDELIHESLSLWNENKKAKM